MSTEHDDDTRPLPRAGAHERTSGDHPTTPVPRADAGGGEWPTEVLGTSRFSGAERGVGRGQEPGPDAPTAQLRPEPATERITTAVPAGSRATGTASRSAAGGPPAIESAASGPAASRAAVGAPAPSEPDSGPAASGSAAGGEAVGGWAREPAGGGSTFAEDRPASTAVGTWPVTPEPPVSTSMRVGTVVWGLVLAIIGAGVIAIAAGAQFDLELVLIGLLALAGVALVVGSVVTSARRHR